MIFDKIENSGLYTNLNPRIAAGLKYISETDFSKVEIGKYVIDEDNILAYISLYQSKDKNDCKLEAHRKYIDIQCITSGCESIGVTHFNNQDPTTPYNDEKDVLFFNEEVSEVKLEAGMFAIFFPDDLHMPGIKCKESVMVKKIVVKVKV